MVPQIVDLVPSPTAETDAPRTPMPFSASRISTWIRCPTRAAWQYIAGYPEEGTDATELGTAVHDELERIKKNPGALPNMLDEIGAIAAEALPHVADLSLEDGASIEGEFTFQGRHKWRGKIDIEKPGDLRDYKTTSDFRWMKTPEELMADPQAILYAERMFRRLEAKNDAPLPSDATVQGTWIYLRKRKPYAARTVQFTMTRAHAAAGFAALESYADEMQTAAYAAPADPPGVHRFILDTIPKNPEACNDFHRQCPHYARCGMSFFNTMSTDQRKTPTMGLLERLQQMNAFSGAANVPPAAPAPPAPVAVRPAAVPPPLPAAVPSVAAVSPAPVVPDLATAPTVADKVAPGQVNPPPRRPGRPPGAKNKATLAAEAAALVASPPAVAPSAQLAQAPAPAPTAAPAPVPQTAAVPQNAEHRIATLFVGCMPSGVGADTDGIVDFDTLIAKAKIGIGPQDYRLFEYGKGNGMLLQMFQAVVQHDKPASVVVMSTMSPEAILCLSYLRSISGVKVEAMR
jgi:RecB family exonuclease